MNLINFQQYLNTGIHPYARFIMSDMCVHLHKQVHMQGLVCVCVSTQTQSVFLEGLLVDVRRGGLAGGFSPAA